ncbi:hypothetical protein CEXT_123721 [Caerostris extrusa]|uniref:Uncharacterized protein n=1 Tax=Caerostris extrusa TaxID=172846 RepID=A0AAV4UY05_CAEEX|nr:hypothetical protein CEXT_123721 [Caerostris extrusa]
MSGRLKSLSREGEIRQIGAGFIVPNGESEMTGTGAQKSVAKRFSRESIFGVLGCQSGLKGLSREGKSDRWVARKEESGIRCSKRRIRDDVRVGWRSENSPYVGYECRYNFIPFRPSHASIKAEMDCHRDGRKQDQEKKKKLKAGPARIEGAPGPRKVSRTLLRESILGFGDVRPVEKLKP